MKTIDLTPSWEAILPAILACYDTGQLPARDFVVEELTRMARLADNYVKEHTV